MQTKRLLLIDKLVVAIPDDIPSKDGRPEIGIAEIFDYLAKYYRTAECAMHNQNGNYRYFFSNLPQGMMPSLNQEENDKLVQYVTNDPECSIAGMMASLIYDEEIGGYYRNAYTEREMGIFEERKRYLDCPSPCDGCDGICDEVCPADPASAERMKEDDGDGD